MSVSPTRPGGPRAPSQQRTADVEPSAARAKELRKDAFSNQVAAAGPALEAGPSREVPVKRLALSGPLSRADAEVSGMAWHGDELVVLPQFPQRLSPERPALFTLSRSDVLSRVDGDGPPLEPRQLPIEPPDFARYLPGFDGFEAIAFVGDRAYLLVEASEGRKTVGYLVPGRIEGGRLLLDCDGRRHLGAHSSLRNLGFEALSVVNGKLVVMGELNAAPANPGANALVFDLELNLLGRQSVPQVQYRVTDATPADEDGRFWVANYKMDRCEYPLGEDPLASAYGLGPTHARIGRVERLVELEEKDGQIRFTRRPPIQIQLDLGDDGRNWEAVARLDGRGFLLMTDRFPDTILAFVPAE